MKKKKGCAVTELLLEWRDLGEEKASLEENRELAAKFMTLWTRSSDGGDNVTCLLSWSIGSCPHGRGRSS